MRYYFSFYFIDLLLIALFVYLCVELKFKHSADVVKEFTYFNYTVPKNADPNIDHVNRFEVPTILKAISKKKFISVELTTDSTENQKRLDFIQFEARRLKYTKDTNQVIKVFIPDSTRYGTFLNLLYIMNEDQHKRYFEYQNWFYIFGEASFEQIKTVKEIPAIEL
jgi:hypothetical protein